MVFSNNSYFFKHFWKIFFFFILACIQTSIFAAMVNEKPEYSNIVILIGHAESYRSEIAIPTYFKQAITAKRTAILVIGDVFLIEKDLPTDSTNNNNFHIFRRFYKNSITIPFTIILPAKNNISEESALKRYGCHLDDKTFEKESKDQYSYLNFDKFSKMVPKLIEKLFSMNPQSPKIVWIMGHGQADDFIAKLQINDFAELLSILEKKNTKITWVTSCFFGGKNLKAIQDHFNKEKSQMIVLSQSTSEIRTYYSLVDFDAFFQGCKEYFDQIRSLKESRKYFAENIIPAILNCNEHDRCKCIYKNFNPTEQRILSIPTVRIPSDEDSDFYSLASLVIDSELIKEKTASNEPINVENQEVIFIDVSEVTVPIIIKGRMPIIVLATHKFDGFSFKTITITNTQTLNLENLAYYLFGDSINFYEESPREITFLITSLKFPTYNEEFKNVKLKHYPRPTYYLNNNGIL